MFKILWCERVISVQTPEQWFSFSLVMQTFLSYSFNTTFIFIKNVDISTCKVNQWQKRDRKSLLTFNSQKNDISFCSMSLCSDDKAGFKSTTNKTFELFCFYIIWYRSRPLGKNIDIKHKYEISRLFLDIWKKTLYFLWEWWE